MPYGDFTLERVREDFGIATDEARLFPDSPRSAAPGWLLNALERRTQLSLLSEKSRSEFIVVPILMASRELSPTVLAIFSGQRLDVDPGRGLSGECDFILAAAPPVPPLRAPIVTIVEAKKNDIENGLGQCVAQMVGARLFNQAADRHAMPIYGCVTTGEVWQFLKLAGDLAIIDDRRYYLDDVEGILGAVLAIVAEGHPPT